MICLAPFSFGQDEVGKQLKTEEFVGRDQKLG